MKVRRSIFWLCMIAVAFVVMLFWLARNPTVARVPVSPDVRSGPPSVFRQPTTVHSNTITTASNSTSSEPASKSERSLGLLSTYNDVPIDFYGKLEDQFGNPVAGAEIKGSIMVINGKRESTDHPSTISDASGSFEFHGRGERIGVMPYKKGYALASTNNGGIYSLMWPEEQRLHPDPYNPVVIKMWKLQGGEPLLKINETFKLAYTAAPINFDLVAGMVLANGGDVRITIIRSPGIARGQSRPDWSIRIEAVDGGLIESDGQEAITYMAPDSGYQMGTNFIFSTNAPYKWTAGFDQWFFVMSRNGQVYSKVILSFEINRSESEPMRITFRGVANTNGSRNWEGDPNTINR